MKKTILSLLFLLAACTAFAQETPVGTLIPVNGQFFMTVINGDTAIYHYKGFPYGYERLAKYKDIRAAKATTDSLKNKTITINGSTQPIGSNPSFTVSGGGTTINYITREKPAGALNGTNQTFVLSHTPVIGTECVFINGVLQNAGAGNDYTITGATVSMLYAPASTDLILINYQY